MSNISSDNINQARTVLEQSQEGLILLGKNPTLDQAASALSLYLALSARGKRISVSCPDQMTVGFNHLVGVDKISGNIGNGGNGKNLVISFPYQEGSIEKVSYNIENDTFNLVIEPRESYPQVTQDMIRYSYSGGNTDLIITMGISGFNELENTYPDSQNIFTNKQIINIDSNPANQMFGKINLVDPQVSSISEMLTSLISQLGLAMDADISSNLYAGIVEGSNNFTSEKTTAETFESAAVCLKKGANKPNAPVQSYNNQGAFTQKPAPGQFSTPPKQTFPGNFAQDQMAKPAIPQMGFRSQPIRNKPVQAQQFPQQQMRQQPQVQQQGQPKQQQETPPDWLKPKIYKGTSLL